MKAGGIHSYTLSKHEIRSPNFVIMYTNAEGKRMVETGGDEIHSFQGHADHDTTQYVAAYVTVYTSSNPVFGNSNAPTSWNVNLIIFPQVGVSSYNANINIRNSPFFNGTTPAAALINNQNFPGATPPCIKYVVSAKACNNLVTTSNSVNCPTNTDYTISSNVANPLLVPNNELEFSLFPNPSNTYLDVHWAYPKTALQPIDIRVYDVNGRTLIEQQGASKENFYRIATEGVANGVYFIKLSDGTKDSIKKFIIQHD